METQAIIALVIGIIAIIQQWSRTGLYQTVQGKIQESLETVARKMAVKSCSIPL